MAILQEKMNIGLVLLVKCLKLNVLNAVNVLIDAQLELLKKKVMLKKL